MIISWFWDEEKLGGNEQQVKIKSTNLEQKESLITEEELNVPTAPTQVFLK